MDSAMNDAIFKEGFNEKEARFNEIYDQYFDRVFRFVSFRVNDHFAAQDLTSEIFQKVFTKSGTYDAEIGRFDVWLFTIARNVVKDYYRKKARCQWIPFFSFSDILTSNERTEDGLEREEEYAYLRKIIARQKPRDQMILSYKFGAELSNEDISLLMDITPNHVAVILHRLLKKLKKEMEVYYDPS